MTLLVVRPPEGFCVFRSLSLLEKKSGVNLSITSSSSSSTTTNILLQSTSSGHRKNLRQSIPASQMPPKSARGRRAKSAAATRKTTPKKSAPSPDPPAAEESPDTRTDVALGGDTESPAPENSSVAADTPLAAAAVDLLPATDNPSDEKPAGEVEESGKDAQEDCVLESPTSETLAVKEEGEGNSNGGKTKKMVKKTVKVVKKVIKKVPKKVVKRELGNTSNSKDENSAETESSLQVSDGVKLEAEEAKGVSISSDAGMNDAGMNDAENCASDVSVPAKMEEAKTEEEKDGVEVEGECGKVEEIGAMEVDKDDVKKENEEKDGVEVEGKCGNVEESGAMEVDSDVKKENKEKDEVEGEVKVEESRAIEVENDVKKENEDSRVENGDGEVKEEKEKEKENEDLSVENGDEEVKEKENEKEKEKEEEKDETGEAKFFSGELEAMERRKRRRTEIFIGGLDKDATEEDVRKVFEQVGEIVDLRVVMNAKTGKNKGFAFLRYASADDARKALEKFAKVEICGKQCGATPVEGNDTVFLGNIDKKWKNEDVLKLLQENGIEKIDKVTAMMDPNKSDCNRGFAFVEFETSKDAQNAFKKLQKKEAFGKHLNIKVAWAEPLKELDEEEMLKVKTIYAEFIPSSWDEEKVRDTFKKFGEIDDIVLARNLKTTKRKDFAFINYKTREAAIECIESFGREVKDEDGTKVNVKVSLAKPMQRGKKQKPVAKPVAKEVPRKKQKISHHKSRASELVSRAQQALPQPGLPHYDIQFGERPSTNAELAHLFREQAPWRASHVGMNSGPMDMHYPSSSFPVRKHQPSMLEADPLRPDMGRYPYPHFDASYPVASSSRNVMPLPTSGLPGSLPYHHQHSLYPSGSAYGGSNYPSNPEMRGRPHGSNFPYHRY